MLVVGWSKGLMPTALAEYCTYLPMAYAGHTQPLLPTDLLSALDGGDRTHSRMDGVGVVAHNALVGVEDEEDGATGKAHNEAADESEGDNPLAVEMFLAHKDLGRTPHIPLQGELVGVLCLVGQWEVGQRKFGQNCWVTRYSLEREHIVEGVGFDGDEVVVVRSSLHMGTGPEVVGTSGRNNDVGEHVAYAP